MSYHGWISWYLLLLCLCLPLFSLLLSLPRLLRPTLLSEMPQTVLRDQTAELRYVLKTSSMAGQVRLRIQIRDLFGGTVQKQRHILRADTPLSIPLPTDHCGVYVAAVPSAVVTDLLGLFAFPVRRKKTMTLLVLPRAKQVETPELLSHHAAAYRPKPGGGLSERYELREYRPGDPVQAIHWKLSAKRDEPILREAQESVRHQVVLGFSLTPKREQMDHILDEICGVTHAMLRLEEQPVLYWRDAADVDHTMTVDSPQRLEEVLRQLLQSPVKQVVHPNPNRFRHADWYCQIPPVAEQEAAT